MRKDWKRRALLAVLAACGIILSVSAGIGQYRKQGKAEIVFIPKVYDEDNDFWMDTIHGARSAAKEFQAELTVFAPEVESDYLTQIAYIEKAIAQKPDVIAISPILYSDMTEEIEKITEAGIGLVLIDSRIDKDIEACYIGTDNINAGIALGQEMAQFVEDDTKIAVVAHVKGASTAIEREEGMRQGLGGSQRRIEEIMYCNSDYGKAYELTKEMFGRRADINMVAGLNLYSIIGAARAVDELGLGGKVKVIGFDNDKKGIQYMEEGIIDALVVQKPFNMGYLGIEAAVRVAHGEPVEKVIDSGMEVITADNIYTGENEKLLFSF
ncbi:MAG: substrate-binding domain-containing protein [Lachnospiraceae bacterium]|jgi:ribose transport system substrate-binding protein|nr:substrate-binding domain-containing protein [Lachnospiraceae bacterium]